MFAQIKEAFTALVISFFSKKFIAFVIIAVALVREQRWNEAIAAFIAYATAEVADKKIETKPAPTPTPVPVPPEATPEPLPPVPPEEPVPPVTDLPPEA